MLLRRIAAALRRQDWATVFIEFVLVVAGVLFALQVNNWAGEAAKRAAERDALERLFLESQNAYYTASISLERTQRINALRRNAVAFIDSDAPVPENTLPIKIGVNTMGQFPPLTIVSVVYDELRSSGQMSLIRSAELRDAVSAFHADLESLNVLQQGFRDGTDEFWKGYFRHVTWRYNRDATDLDIVLSTYNWESIRQDKAFLAVAIGLLRNQIVNEDGLVGVKENAKQMCDLLGDAVGRTCAEPVDQSGEAR